jgi:hypothetical protein
MALELDLLDDWMNTLWQVQLTDKWRRCLVCLHASNIIERLLLGHYDHGAGVNVRAGVPGHGGSGREWECCVGVGVHAASGGGGTGVSAAGAGRRAAGGVPREPCVDAVISGRGAGRRARACGSGYGSGVGIGIRRRVLEQERE